jgi:hypothetical protein
MTQNGKDTRLMRAENGSDDLSRKPGTVMVGSSKISADAHKFPNLNNVVGKQWTGNRTKMIHLEVIDAVN